MAAAKGRVCIMFCGMFITGHYPRSPSWVVVLLCLLRPGCGSSTRYCCGSVDTSMSSDKRALDELDALFRDVPAKAVCSSSRPATKLCDGGKASAPSTAAKPRSGAKRKRGGGTEPTGAASATANAPKQLPLYTRLQARLLPRGLRGAPPASRSSTSAVGVAAATRLTDFVRGVLGTRGDRAATFAIESRLQRKVVHLENVSAQTGAQSAGARAARAAGRVRQGLSGKQCKKKGLNVLKTRDGGKLSFKHMLGVHELWKSYAGRLVSQCGSNQKLLQQRILGADLQLVTPAGKTKSVPKRGCAFRLAFGGFVIDLAGKALESRRAGQKSRAEALSKGAGDRAAFPLQTLAL